MGFRNLGIDLSAVARSFRSPMIEATEGLSARTFDFDGGDPSTARQLPAVASASLRTTTLGYLLEQLAISTPNLYITFPRLR